MYGKTFEGKKAVIFDLDGTIILSDDLWKRAYQNVLKVLGFTDVEIEAMPFVAGVRLEDIWYMVIDGYEIPNANAKELTKHTENEFLKIIQSEEIPITPGFWSIGVDFKERGYKTALVTNTGKVATDAIMKKLHIENSFDLVLTGDDVSKPKPNPEIYNLAIKKLGLKKDQIIVFEDSVTGSNASISAGLDTIVIMSDYNITENAYSNAVLGFIADFEALLGNLDDTLEEQILAYQKAYKENKPQDKNDK